MIKQVYCQMIVENNKTDFLLYCYQVDCFTKSLFIKCMLSHSYLRISIPKWVVVQNRSKLTLGVTHLIPPFIAFMTL